MRVRSRRGRYHTSKGTCTARGKWIRDSRSDIGLLFSPIARLDERLGKAPGVHTARWPVSSSFKADAWVKTEATVSSVSEPSRFAGGFEVGKAGGFAYVAPKFV